MKTTPASSRSNALPRLRWKLVKEREKYYTSEIYEARPELSPEERSLDPLPHTEIVAEKMKRTASQPFTFPAVFFKRRDTGRYVLGVFVTGVFSNPERFCDFHLFGTHRETPAASKKMRVESKWRVPMDGKEGRVTPRLSPRVQCHIEDDRNTTVTPRSDVVTCPETVSPCSEAALRQYVDRILIHILSDHEKGAYSRVVDAVMKDAGFENAWASAKKALRKSFFFP